MIRIEGGTQALRRTVNARLEIVPGTTATISVPRPFGALILTLVAHLTPDHPAWRALPEDHRTEAQLTLDILGSTDEESVTRHLTAPPSAAGLDT